MIRYEVTAEQECSVPGIGMLTAGETVELTEFQIHNFTSQLGYPPVAGNWPSWVKFTTVLTDEEA